jgi:hypothetical protein
MRISTLRRKDHTTKKEKTRSITYRLPERVVEELETEANQKNISQNVLVKQILEKYVEWERFTQNIGMIPVPKSIVSMLGEQMVGKDIDKILSTLGPLIKESVLFMKGKYDMKRCIEALEDYMKASGMKSDHRIEGDQHHFIIQHDLGMKWSLFTEQLLKEIFHEFEPEKNVRAETTDKTVIITIGLGSDFNEHDY